MSATFSAHNQLSLILTQVEVVVLGIANQDQATNDVYERCDNLLLVSSLVLWRPPSLLASAPHCICLRGDESGFTHELHLGSCRSCIAAGTIEESLWAWVAEQGRAGASRRNRRLGTCGLRRPRRQWPAELDVSVTVLPEYLFQARLVRGPL